MSKYTVQLRWIVEQALNDLHKSHDESNWKYIYSKVGLDRYPMYGGTSAISDSNRERLNNMIIRHYWMREIGFETAGQFKWYMNAKMQEIMPYYNKLYAAEATMTVPLREYSENVTENKAEDWESANASHAESNASDSNRNVYQETPMSLLSNIGSPSIEDLDYATNVTYDSGESSGENDSTSSGNGSRDTDTTTQRYGNRQMESVLLKKYHDSLLNIDMEITENLSTMFMGLW